MDRKKVGILLANLGSPEAPTKKAVRKYLAEFLTDKRIVDLPGYLWRPVLYGIILNTRPKKVAVAYRKIWGNHKSSPLVRECRLAGENLSAILGKNFLLEPGMRYGKPSIPAALEKLGKIDKLIVLPMFPQFSSATTASIFDMIGNYYQNKRNIPEVRFIQNYHAHPLYIKALAKSVHEHWDKKGQADKFIISFHGLPQRYIKGGDPYKLQCETTARLLGAELGHKYMLTFQSRFGKELWLKPATESTLISLAQQGIKSVDIISPGFSIDCLETLEELAISAHDTFIKAGGNELTYIPALNSEQPQIKLYADLIKQHSECS